MHILLIHQAFAAINEAGGTRHHEIARVLANQGNTITIIASPISYLTGEKTPMEDISNDFPRISIYRTYTYPALHKSFFHRAISFFSFMVSSFFRAIRTKNVDLVWATSPPIFQAFTAWLIARMKRVPLLFEVRDLWPAFAIAVGVLKSTFLIRLSLWLEKFLYKNADAIVVNSPGYIDHIKQKGGENINIIPNGSDIALFSPLPNGKSFRKEHNLSNQFIVMYCGAHGISNDLEVILRAAQIMKQEKEIVFIFTGDGKEKPNLVSFAKNNELENVVFIDPLPKNKLKNALASADVCIAILKPLDLYKTTYPNKVFDYMAAGKPIVLMIDGEIRKIVENANCGIFCEPGNPTALVSTILDLRQNKSLLTKMGTNGKKYLVSHFDRTQLALKMLDVMKKVSEQKWQRKY